MGENMNYPDNPIDFIKQYSFSDKQRVYTNGSELISVFRVGQMIDHYMSDLTPQQIKDMQFCLREKSRECVELRKRIRELEEGGKDNDGWIPVEERLPEGKKTVLVCQHGGAIDVAWHDGYRWKTGFSHADWLSNVIAWRSLPEPYCPESSGV